MRKALILLLIFVLLIHSVKADLPRIYHSEDVDVNSTNLSQFCDFVFLSPPKLVFMQNSKFIANFPKTDVWKSAIPIGVATKSYGVIRDAYFKLFPVNCVKVGRYYVKNGTAKVAFLLDYRIHLPPDETAGYPKYFYKLLFTRVRVQILNRTFRSCRGFVETGSNVVKARATITAVVLEKIVRKHEECKTVCDSNRSWYCWDECDVWYTTSYLTHTYRLVLKDELDFERPTASVVYELVEGGKPVQYYVKPSNVVSTITCGNCGVEGIKYIATYAAIKNYELCSEGGCKIFKLKEPYFEVVQIPSYCLIATCPCAVDYEFAKVEIPNFKLDTKLKLVNGILVRCNGKIRLLNVFGKPTPLRVKRKMLARPEVKVLKEKLKNNWSVRMEITYAGKKYSGPVYLSFPDKEVVMYAKDGLLTFRTNSSLSYFIPSNLPKNWWNNSTVVFCDAGYGRIDLVSKKLLAFYEFALIASAALPFVVFYKVLEWAFRDENEYI